QPAASRQYARTEDHLSALFLKYLPVVVDLAESVPDSMLTDARNRELMAILRQTPLTHEWHAGDLLATIDEALARHGRAILEDLPPLPPPLPGDIREELLQSIVKLQREHYEALAGHLKAEIAVAQRERDVETFAELRAHLERLPE